MTTIVAYGYNGVLSSGIGTTRYYTKNQANSGNLTIEEVVNHTAPYAVVLESVAGTGGPALGQHNSPWEMIPDYIIAEDKMVRFCGIDGNPGLVLMDVECHVPADATVRWVDVIAWHDGASAENPSLSLKIGATAYSHEFARPTGGRNTNWTRLYWHTTTNPATGAAWVPNDFPGLQAGVSTQGGSIAGLQVVVEYEEEDKPMSRVGSAKAIYTNASASPSAAARIAIPFGTRLVLNHKMSGTTTGGYVSVENVHKLAPSGETVAPHHGSGANIPTGNRNASYSCVFKDCAEYVDVTLHWVDGTHNVSYELLCD